MSEANGLPDYEGLEVVEATAAVRRAGDGLSEAMHFAPFVIHKGERRFLLIEVECVDVQHPWVNKKDHAAGTQRKHILDAYTGVFLDSKAAEKAIQDQAKMVTAGRERERIAREEAKGVFTFDNEEDEELE